MRDPVIKPSFKFCASALMALAAASASLGEAYAAENEASVASVARPGYAWIADLVTSNPAIAVVTVKKLSSVSPERAPGLAPGQQRFLISAETQSLIRSNNVLAREMSFLLDLPATPKGKPPKWKKRVFILFGEVQDRVDFFQLQSSDAILDWSPENEALVRRVAGEMTGGDVPPAIADIDSVFHVQGAVAGEGETQIFVNRADGSPISLSVIRRPDEKPQFGVSLGEVVDDAAAMPKADTPLWYRLACSLPPRLPQRVLRGQAPADADAASRDYAAFVAALAPCKRDPVPLQ